MSTEDANLLFYQKQLGKRLRNLRLERSLSQLDLATICDVEKSTISRIENGRTNMTLKTMLILSNALNLDLPTFVDISKSETDC